MWAVLGSCSFIQGTRGQVTKSMVYGTRQVSNARTFCLSHFPTAVDANICTPQQYWTPGVRGGASVLSEGVKGELVVLGKTPGR